MSGTDIPFTVYDCFTDTTFGGNLGAIVWSGEALSSGEMQAYAREFNAPVTGFITAQNGPEITARFFMPATEIAMCGHVTVGLFSHLARQNSAETQNYILKAQAGDVAVDVDMTSGAPMVMMGLSLPQPLELDVDRAALATALGVAAGKIPLGGADAGLKHLFMQMETEDALRDLTPDFGKLGDLSRALGIHTVACFAMAPPGAEHTLSIRDFCPAVGVNETPASGTTNGALTGYLLAQNLIPAQSQRIVADQGREIGRPSRVVSDIEITDGALSGLKTGGMAVESYRGTLSRAGGFDAG